MIMASEIFHGYAYGVPLHGKIITHDAPYYRAFDRAELPAFSSCEMNQPVKIDVPVVEYRFNSHDQWVLS